MARQTLYKSPHPQLEEWPPPVDGAPYSDEPARDVYVNSCAKIAEALTVFDFKYTKSKQRCYREHHGFGNVISFQSSHYNVSGRHAQLWMYATVSSRLVQAWRAERLPEEHASENLAGGMVHLLGTRFALVQWELADPHDRAATIADAVTFIRDEVLSYFKLFEDPAALITRLVGQSLPGMDLRSSVEFAYCYGGKEQAKLVLDRFVQERTDLHEAINAEAVRLSSPPRAPSGGYAQQVVFLRKHYQLV